MQTRIILSFVFFAALFVVLFTETASAQFFRRQYQRVPAAPPDYRTRRILDEPLVQGDGRLLERVRDVVNLFTEGGAELKPIAVVSLASFEEFKRVLQIVAKEIRLDKDSTDEPALLTAFLGVYERIVNQGFDTKQPVGMILQTDGVLYYPLFFTPLNLNSQLGQSFQKKYLEQLPDGRSVLREEIFQWPLGRLYVRQYNGWLFIASEQQLNALPNDPTVLLQGLDRKHLMAARFDLQNLPALSTRAALSLGEMNAVAQAETEIEKATARLGIGYLRSLAEQADFLEYTISYDEEHADYVIEQKEIVKPNTERAKLLQERRNAKSSFHAFYHPEEAILASHFVMNLTQSQSKELETILDEAIGKHLLTEEERQEWKRQIEERNQPPRKRRNQKTVTETEADNPGADPPGSLTANERLAQLLAKVPPEQLEQKVTETETVEAMQELVFSKTPEGELSDPQRLEIIFRRVGVAYYWALIGAVRNGKFDGATTCSFKHGVLGAYNIVEGEKFREAFDSIFANLEREFPDVYAKNVRKDYMQSNGFSLTSISFRPSMFIKNQFWAWFIPPEFSEQEMRLVLGVRNEALCYAVGQGDLPESRLMEAIAGTTESQPVNDLFFTFSAYEFGQSFAKSGDPNRFPLLKIIAADTNPNARAYAVSKFTDTSKTLTLRISALLTPSIWRCRENLRLR